MDAQLLLKACTLTGKILLESGAETIRVEQTVLHFCSAFDGKEVNVFATPTGLFVSFEHDDITYSKTCRIKSTTINLNRINHVNELSRNCSSKQYKIEDAYKHLLKISNMSGYSNRTMRISSGLVATFFTLLFNFDLVHGVCAFFIGYFIQVCQLYFMNKNINSVVRIMFLSMIISFSALLFLQFNIIVDKDSVIIGSLMLLVPGVAITNAIRDTISGDLLSGLTRGLEAFLIAIALAIGAGVTIAIWTNYIGGAIL